MTRRERLSVVTVALLALAATITSIGHDFTFDDKPVIFANDAVHSLHRLWRLFGQTYWSKDLGGDGYRPVVMVLFSLQWATGGGAPWVFHLGNILLAVATAIAVWWCAAAILPPPGALAAAALFAVHPVHVEVTGNVVGQSELIVALCLSLAIGVYLRARRTGWLRPLDAATVIVLYVVGLLSKEHAIVLPALLLAAELTVIQDPDRRGRVRQARPFVLLLIAVTLAYLYVRGLIQRDLAGFVPYPVFRYLEMSALDRVAMMMTEVPRVARLLVFPAHLSGDYSPTDVVVQHGFDVTQLPGIFIVSGVLTLAIVLRRRAPVVSFGLLWLAIAFLPVSNLLIPAGFITAERTLFFPSVGVMLVGGAVVAAAVARPERWARRTAVAAASVLVALGLARSIDRQRVWKNNDVFFNQLVKDEPDGYRAHYLRGRHVRTHQRFREAELEYKRALRLFPYDVNMTLSIAADYYNAGLCEPAVALLRWSYYVEPLMADGRFQVADCLARLGRWQESRSAALEGLHLGFSRDSRRMRAAVARADSALGRARGYALRR